MRFTALTALVCASHVWLSCNTYGPELLPSAAITASGGSGGAGLGGAGGNDSASEGGASTQPPAAGGATAKPEGGAAAVEDNDGGMPGAGSGAGGAAGGAGGAPPNASQGGIDAGGTGGSAAPVDAGPPVVIVPANPALIDDFEARSLSIRPYEMRSGAWFIKSNANDMTGRITPFLATKLDEPREDSKYAVHIVASGYQLMPTWAGFGANFSVDNTVPMAQQKPAPYPGAAKYKGIAFWAKHGGSTESATLRVELPTSDTHGELGGDDDNFGMLIDFEDTWTQHTVLWTKVRQGGWGVAKAFSPSKLTAVQFTLSSPDTGFDVWLDDIEFVE